MSERKLMRGSFVSVSLLSLVPCFSFAALKLMLDNSQADMDYFKNNFVAQAGVLIDLAGKKLNVGAYSI